MLTSRKGLKSNKPLSRSSRPKAMGKTTKVSIQEDDIFYLSVWENREHVCEECGTFLGDTVVNDDGRVIIRIYFSHILGKNGMYARFRHDKRNINLLCGECHQKWEDASIRESMKIYEPNMVIVDELISEMNNGRA